MTDPVVSTPRVVDAPALHAAVIWIETDVAGMGGAQENRPVVRQEAQAAGLSLTGRTMTVWRMLTPERIRVAPGVLVTAPFATVGALEHLHLGGTAAHLRLEGHFGYLSVAWEALFLTCHRQGWRPSGLNWEVYENDDVPGGAPAADLYAQLG